MPASFNINDASVVKAFKVKYNQKSKDYYNGKNVTLGTIKKTYDFTGKQKEGFAVLGFQGGAGFGKLPYANRGVYETPTLTRKKVYAVCEIDGETVAAAKGPDSFVESMSESTKRTVQKFNWLRSFGLFGQAGKVGTIAASSGVSEVTAGSVYDITISDATWVAANWELRDFVNFGTSTDLWEITGVTRSTKVVRVTKVTGSTIPANSDVVYLQGSKDLATTGLKDVCDATGGSLYGVTVQDRWKSVQIAAGGAPLDVDMLNQISLELDEFFGERPKTFVTSFTQMRKVATQMEDRKAYFSNTTIKSRYGDWGFDGIKYMAPNGPVTLVAERFCDASRLYTLNPDYIEACHAPDMGWVEEGNFMFLRKAGEDAYEARYRAYCNDMIVPTAQGVVTGLSIS